MRINHTPCVSHKAEQLVVPLNYVAFQRIQTPSRSVSPSLSLSLSLYQQQDQGKARARLSRKLLPIGNGSGQSSSKKKRIPSNKNVALSSDKLAIIFGNSGSRQGQQQQHHMMMLMLMTMMVYLWSISWGSRVNRWSQFDDKRPKIGIIKTKLFMTFLSASLPR